MWAGFVDGDILGRLFPNLQWYRNWVKFFSSLTLMKCPYWFSVLRWSSKMYYFCDMIVSPSRLQVQGYQRRTQYSAYELCKAAEFVSFADENVSMIAERRLARVFDMWPASEAPGFLRFFNVYRNTCHCVTNKELFNRWKRKRGIFDVRWSFLEWTWSENAQSVAYHSALPPAVKEVALTHRLRCSPFDGYVIEIYGLYKERARSLSPRIWSWHRASQFRVSKCRSCLWRR